MHKGHFETAGEHVEYGDASYLFPVEQLDATVRQYRDAQREIQNVCGEDVVAVAPTSLASSYALTQRPLTAIVVDTLSIDTFHRLDSVTDARLDSFAVIQIGKWTSESENHSLSEFTQA